ncbi:MAG TPA: lipid-binding SYLF domain-containing protein [Acetobacteraceae bacterium]|jgi:lipid-binding SYLF domain-containing protein|nr:lipid-binding SYLF domain-containing protein [Acetobacteraceae bacterium]
MTRTRRSTLVWLAGLTGVAAATPTQAFAASASRITRDADHALRTLYAAQPKARDLSKRAKAILVFPKVIKAGLLIGGQGGDGALQVAGKTTGYYNIAAASFGLQAGAQAFSYAMFFMTDSALQYLQSSDGWSIGSGPSVVAVDKGSAASLTSTTLSQDVYAFPFGQHGLMAGIDLEGSKITRINPGP